jgi:hypothetical protein
MDDDGLPMWTIYEYPSDYPQGYVVRRGVARATGYVPDTIAQYAPTLEAAMRLLPPGLYPLGRQPDDDAVIVGVWV